MKLPYSLFNLFGQRACSIFAVFTGLGISLPFCTYAQNLLVNGSFEALTQSVPNSTYTISFGDLPTSVAVGWILGASGSQSFDGVATVNGGPISNYSPTAIADGTNAIFLQGTGSASQTLSLNPGQYILTYSLMGRAGSAGSSPNPITVSLSGGLVHDVEMPANTDVNNQSDWTTYSIYFSVTNAGAYTLQFQGSDPYGVMGDHTTFIDNVSISPFSAVAPVIVSEPPSQQTLFAGQTAPFTVQASGALPPSYQWQIQINGSYVNLTNGGRISGVTSDALIVSNLIADDATNYRVHISSLGGTIDSAATALTVLPRPSFDSLRDSVTIINPSFEDNQQPGDIYTKNFGSLDPSNGIAGWQFGSSGGDSFCGMVTESGVLLGMAKHIPQCWQAAFLQGTGHFSQSVTFKTAGTYLIRFRAESRSNGGAGAEPISVSVDGDNLGAFTPLPGQWTLFSSSPFTVADGVHVISFAGTIPYSTSDRTSFIDDVQIVTPGELVAATPPLSPVYDIVFVGDSITAGATLSDSSTQATPVRCMESLGQRFNVAMRMSNQGHSGHTTVDWLPSSNPSSDFQLALAAATSLETNQPGQLIFSIMLGANDSAQSGPNGAPVSPANYRQNLQSIVDQFLANDTNALIFVQYPTWYSTNTHNSAVYDAAGLARLESYFPEIDQLITNNQTIHPGRVFAGDKLAFNYLSTNYLTDLTPESGAEGTFYLHPNAAGAIVLGKFWADAIATTLQFSTNNAYSAWLQSRDMVPGASGSGFDETPSSLLPDNGISYSNPYGLMAEQGTARDHYSISADVRDDPLLTVVLQLSDDLIHWSPVTWSMATNQTNVATGFTRYALQGGLDPLHNEKFYRLEMNYQ